MKRTIGCGDLRPRHIGEHHVLAGWVHRQRDHGGLVFIDLRDRSGVVQLVADPQHAAGAHAAAAACRSEFVVLARGAVRRRPAGTENPALATGEVEVLVDELIIENPSLTPPFPITDDAIADESLRLRYRYLDLRRPRMARNLVLRHRVVKFMRDYLDARGFIEVETPILIKSTPEGARDYLVPSRLHPGTFYALPQSPQQLKQLLMVAGVERYFQIARCFRDEDLRADRQPEFTQLDLEMSFVDQDDILNLVEGLYTELVEALTTKRVPRPFPRFTFAEVMDRYGSDKPDLRYGMEIVDLSAPLAQTEFRAFRTVLENGGRVRGIAAPGAGGFTRRQLDELVTLAQAQGAKGLAWMVPGSEGPRSSGFARVMAQGELAAIVEGTGAKPGDLVLLVADEGRKASQVLGALRVELARRLDLLDRGQMAFAWVTDFPLLEWNADEGRWDSTHHPFTAPHPADVGLLDSDPGAVRAQAYDLICNGYELGSGSIRIHRRDVQQRIFRLLNYTEEEIEARFGHLLRAFQYGAPPHGGIAPGVDRLVMLLADEENLREVIAFPKNQSAVDLMTGAPSPVSEQQLRELSLRLAVPPGEREG